MNVDQREATPWRDINPVRREIEPGARVILTGNIDATFYPRKFSEEGLEENDIGLVEASDDVEGLLAGTECEYLAHLRIEGEGTPGVVVLKITKCELRPWLIGTIVSIAPEQRNKLVVISNN
jgi:hypothetical protein